MRFVPRETPLACACLSIADALGLAPIDRGFQEGRQFGRGKSGGQVRDEYRTDYDVGRGGYGKLVQTGLSELHQRPVPRANADDPAGRKRDRDVEAPSDANKRARENTAEKNPRFRGERADEDDA